MRRKIKRSRPFPSVLALFFVIFGISGILCLCLGIYKAFDLLLREPLPKEATLTIAYSPEKEALFEELVTKFNSQGFETPEGKKMLIEAIKLEPEAMIEGSIGGEFQAISPDSSLWLSQLDKEWMKRTGSDFPLVGETIRYAVSPIVIAMWEEVARSLGYPERAIGWRELLAKAQSDPEFKWSHPSTSSASGLLAVLAEFYAATGKTRGLTIEDVKSKSVLDYVGEIEKTVRYYGEGEWAVVQSLLSEGRGYLDAFVCQEQLVVYFNKMAAPPRLVAIYPVEGSLWEDHPLALLERPELLDEQRLIFRRFSEWLLSRETQLLILSYGYRPVDLSIPLDDPLSPIKAENGVDPSQPKTALQIPGAEVVEVVRDVWWYTKRHTNVYLVVDTSGSMRGEKLESAKEALRIFIGQIKGDAERVGLIEFYSHVEHLVPLEELGENRAELLAEIERLEAGGDTALLDAINSAYIALQMLEDFERINAIVVMTDGKENNSRIGLRELTQIMREGNEEGVPIVVFCIAYGDDADLRTLEEIAEATGGQVRRGDLETIRKLYKILSTYF
jgi:Ca-activated chloride channel family protein